MPIVYQNLYKIARLPRHGAGFLLNLRRNQAAAQPDKSHAAMLR